MMIRPLTTRLVSTTTLTCVLFFVIEFMANSLNHSGDVSLNCLRIKILLGANAV
ncbi:MAG: hypothetical protein JOZ19_14885 [Rubrobacter sp.]|nr:hypothetical protein [Rubrobacter sp.]